jgi:hypothetical protein
MKHILIAAERKPQKIIEQYKEQEERQQNVDEQDVFFQYEEFYK